MKIMIKLLYLRIKRLSFLGIPLVLIFNFYLSKDLDQFQFTNKNFSQLFFRQNSVVIR